MHSATDDYGHFIASSQKYIADKYLEIIAKKQCLTYQLMKKNVYFYKESIIYPYVEFQNNNKDVYTISNMEYCAVCNMLNTLILFRFIHYFG